MTIAIIGAGMAGLSCAQTLAAGGRPPRVFDKGRGPGGRMSTRRADTPLGVAQWDHGAQYFTARNEAFQHAVSEWLETGVVAEWGGVFCESATGGARSEAPAKQRYVGMPGMNGVIRYMAEGLSIDWAVRVKAVTGGPGDYMLEFEDRRSEGPFEAVVVAVPAEQAADLLWPVDREQAKAARRASSDPCWTLMTAYEDWQADFAGLQIKEGPLSWIGNNTSKPGRAGIQTLVAQAGPDWSQAHLEADPDTVQTALLAALTDLLPDAPEPIHTITHRWRFARVSKPALSAASWDASIKIGACGDWRIGPRVEAAWMSGMVLAERILAS